MYYPPDPSGQFLALSSVLTAYGEVELQATGQAPVYWNTLLGVVGSAIAGDFLSQCGEAFAKSNDLNELERNMERMVMKHPCFGPMAQRIISIWYTATWNPMPSDWCDTYGIGQTDVTHIPSPEAYKEGLIWPTFGSHPRAAKAPGYGSWTYPPIAAVNTDPPKS